MTSIVVLGTSGHARSCLEVLAAAGFDAIGCVGDPPDRPIQVRYLGSDDCLEEEFARGTSNLLVAVGDNRGRGRLMEMAAAMGFDLPSLVAPSATVSPHARIGAGAVVLHGAIVGPYTQVGAGAIINTAASVDHDCEIGDFGHVAPGSHLAGNVRVGTGAFLGVGTSVMPGARIGAWAVVGAGATVIDEVMPGSTVVGTPAHEIGRGNSS